MARRGRKRNKGSNKSNRGVNRNENRKRNSVADKVSNAVIMKFLKQEGDVGLFIDIQGKQKYWVHKQYIYGTLGWIQRGSTVAVKGEYLNPIKTVRLFVQNCPKNLNAKAGVQTNIFDEDDTVDFDELAKKASKKKKEKTYVYGDSVNIIAKEDESIYMGLPIGTQYHWLSWGEFPEEGDYVMCSKKTGISGDLFGYVSDVDEVKHTCKVAGVEVSTYDVGYRITNPLYLRSYKFANA